MASHSRRLAGLCFRKFSYSDPPPPTPDSIVAYDNLFEPRDFVLVSSQRLVALELSWEDRRPRECVIEAHSLHVRLDDSAFLVLLICSLAVSWRKKIIRRDMLVYWSVRVSSI